MSVAKKHVLGFAPNGGKFFALVDEQGVLRIWDTEHNTLKQEFTPNLQATGGCKALTWVNVSASRPKKTRKSLPTAAPEPEKLYLACGTSKGLVVLYSLATGNIERTLGEEGHNGTITSIVYDNNGLLYTVGADCRCLVWSVAEERCIAEWSVGPEKPLNITYLPKNRCLAVASRQIKIYDVDTKELVETCTGHSGEVNAIGSFSYQNELEYVLTTAKMERIISLWKVNKKGRNKAATCTLLMEDVAHSVACEMRDDGQLRVASVTRNGNIHIYLLNVESLSSEKYIKPKVTLQIASDGADTVEPILAVAAHFVHDEQRAHEILFGYGTRRQLQFERYTPNYGEKLNVIVRTDPRKLYAKKKRGDQSGTQEALKTKIPIVSKSEVEYNSALPLSKKKMQNDVPMAARLESLSIKASNLTDGKLESQSKTQLLMQALHSQDQAMLRTVLDTNERKAIRATVERLPLEYISPLLHELSTMLQGKAASVRYAVYWLQALANTRTSVLMSEDKEELRDKLGICLGIAEHRMHCIAEALQVSGRVRLVINHMKRNATNNLNEAGALIVDDDQGDMDTSQINDSNWSDVEDQDTNANLMLDDDDDDEDDQMEADDDVAADVEDLALTQDSSDEGDNDDESGSDTDASAG